MPSTEVIIVAIAALAVGIAVGYIARRYLAASSVKHAEV